MEDKEYTGPMKATIHGPKPMYTQSRWEEIQEEKALAEARREEAEKHAAEMRSFIEDSMEDLAQELYDSLDWHNVREISIVGDVGADGTLRTHIELRLLHNIRAELEYSKYGGVKIRWFNPKDNTRGCAEANGGER